MHHPDGIQGRLVLALVVLGGLAGCGGGTTTTASGTPDPATVFQTQRAAFNTMYDNVLGNSSTGVTGLSHTSDSNMPTSGSADFSGYAKLRAGNAANPSPSFAAVGNATMHADFGTGTLTGKATDFYGAALDPTTGKVAGTPAVMTGEIDLSGCIGPAACKDSGVASYQMKGTASGSLAGGGTSVTLNAPVKGQVYGNPGVKAAEVETVGNDKLGTATLNGATADGGVAFVGLKN